MSVRRIIFTQGLPGAGKTTFLKRNFANYYPIDADNIKQQNPLYDPKRPHEVHKWSIWKRDELFLAAIQAGKGLYTVECTGTNVEKMVDRIVIAKMAGFEIGLVYIRVDLQTALERNAARSRSIPPEIIIEKAWMIEASFERVKQFVDFVIEHDNNQLIQ